MGLFYVCYKGPCPIFFLSKEPSSRLHLRVIRAFGFLVIAPIVLLAVFSGLFLHFGMQVWFNQKVQVAIHESQAVAQAYLKEHQEVIKQNVRIMARGLQENLPQLLTNKTLLDGFLTLQSDLLSLTEVVLFSRDGNVVGRSQFSFSLEFEGISGVNLERARHGIVIYPNQRNDRVIALIALQSEADLYLIVSRKVDQQVIERIVATREAATAYKNLLEERWRFSWQFLILFVVFAGVVLALAIWRGLAFSRQLLKPIQKLIGAARQIQEGDFQARVPLAPPAKIDELEMLAQAFNQMVDEIATQQAELKRTHIELKRRHQFTENVLAGVSSGILGLDAEGRIHLANQRAFELLNQSPISLLDQSLENLLPEWAPVLASPTLPLEAQILTKSSGLYKTFRIHVTGCSTEQESREERVITFEDMTEFLAIQRQAAWSDVARRVAHEIKNPLTPIQLSAERLKRRYLPQIHQDPDTFQKCVETITRQVDVLGRIVSEFSVFARLPKPSFAPVDLKGLVENVFCLHQQAYPHLEWTFTSPSSLIFTCDAQQITQVLTNLIKNAVESIQERDTIQPGVGMITVSLSAESTTAMLSVTDNGCGFSLERGNHFAEPYWTTKEKGTGLGLAIVKKIVEDHGGSLTWEQRESGGATVLVVLANQYREEMSNLRNVG